VGLPRLRRRPQPRHALPTSSAHGRAGDGATLGIIIALILTSGFVAGTTATFTAGAGHSSNVFASAALSGPSFTSASASTTTGALDVELKWVAPSGTATSTSDNYQAGTRITTVDYQAAASNNAGAGYTCPTTGYNTTKVADVTNTANPATTTYNDTTTSDTSNHPAATQLVDGRIWCYRLQSVFPCCAATNPWLSQSTAATTFRPAILGNTMLDFKMTNVTTAGTIAVNDTFDIYMNQPVTSFTGTHMCTNAGGAGTAYILIGLVSNATANTCPKTNTSSKDSTFTGIYLTGGVLSQTTRYTLTINSNGAAGSCGGNYPASCSKINVKLATLVAGTQGTISGTWSAFVSSDTTTASFRTSTGTARNYCASSAGTATAGSTFTYRTNPTNGQCSVTGIASNW
jgi:hypothetical protein